MRWTRKTAELKATNTTRSNGGAEPRSPERSTVDVQESEGCGCAGEGLPLLSEMAIDEIEMLAITLLRFVFAGFCCGKVHRSEERV